MNSREHEIQKSCIEWFDLQYAQLSKHLFAIPNGGYRHKLTAVKLKAEGVRKGVPDLFLAIPSWGKAGLFIEVKTPKGVIRPEQKQYKKRLEEIGYAHCYVRSLEQFMAIINKYLKNDRL